MELFSLIREFGLSSIQRSTNFTDLAAVICPVIKSFLHAMYNRAIFT